MGCDIHLYFEKKVNGKWEKIKVDERLQPDDRNYRLFGFLAGVRGTCFEPQFVGRGVPDDTSLPGTDTRDYYLGDHSYTYAYLDELLKAPWKEAELEECYFNVFCQYVLPRLSGWCGFLSDEEERNIRILMGFDS